MTWPLSQDYNEAIQCSRGNFSDPDLQGSEAVSNSLGIPMPCSGNFADVYQMRSPSGERWAVKCFTREVPGLRERYAAISRHLAQAHLPFIVDFTFQERGIRVCGRWYPVVKMQWVEGLTLNAFVREYADNPSMLKRLLQIWVRMAARLRGAGIAHADLQHGNVLMVPGIAANALVLKLVDYDGMFVPALAGSNSGEVGHPCYQHPQRLAERTYNQELDRFPLLLIATALHCVGVGGRALWDKYDNGDNLLFREADLQAPVKSRLFYELLKLSDERASRLVRHTLDALKGRLEAVPLLEELLPDLCSPSAAGPAMPKPITKAPGTEVRPDAKDDSSSRRRRNRAVPGWVWGVAGMGMAALLSGMFVLPAWDESQRPNKQGDSAVPPPPVPKPRKREAKEQSAKADPPKPKIHLSDDATLAELRAALQNGDAKVQEIAIAHLVKLGPKAEPAMYVLADALTNENNPIIVRTKAAVAIAHIGPAAKKVVTALGRSLHKGTPREVRQYAADALSQIKYPANEEAIPAILNAIEKDPDPQVRKNCVSSLFKMDRTQMRNCGAEKALRKLLDEPGENLRYARYDSARKLAHVLQEDAPDKTVDVLLHMLQAKDLKVYNGKDVKVGEAGKAPTELTDNTGGDARFMAVQALGWLGSKAARNAEVRAALRQAAKDNDEKLRTEARNVLKEWKEKWNIE